LICFPALVRRFCNSFNQLESVNQPSVAQLLSFFNICKTGAAQWNNLLRPAVKSSNRLQSQGKNEALAQLPGWWGERPREPTCARQFSRLAKTLAPSD
jgi:hypothetical protein